MHQRTLGQQGLSVSALGYGSRGINLAYGPSDEQQGITAIKRAHDLGVTFFDTAELYGWGENEKVLGRAVKGFRDDVVIASKCRENDTVMGVEPFTAAGEAAGVGPDEPGRSAAARFGRPGNQSRTRPHPQGAVALGLVAGAAQPASGGERGPRPHTQPALPAHPWMETPRCKE